MLALLSKKKKKRNIETALFEMDDGRGHDDGAMMVLSAEHDEVLQLLSAIEQFLRTCDDRAADFGTALTTLPAIFESPLRASLNQMNVDCALLAEEFTQLLEESPKLFQLLLLTDRTLTESALRSINLVMATNAAKRYVEHLEAFKTTSSQLAGAMREAAATVQAIVPLDAKNKHEQIDIEKFIALCVDLSNCFAVIGSSFVVPYQDFLSKLSNTTSPCTVSQCAKLVQEFVNTVHTGTAK